jgi:bifunctional DNase/RNase
VVDSPIEQVTHPNFRVMELVEVLVPLPQMHAVVQLVERESPHRTLSFPIGLAEGAALAAAKERTAGVRPSTHELFAETLARLNVDVIAVRLTGESDGVYRAELDCMTARGREVFDCRPSDGLVLALRQTVIAPLLADERLLA